MAGRVRHPIDIKALEAYLTKHVPEIKVPLDVKQVSKQTLTPHLSVSIYTQPI